MKNEIIDSVPLIAIDDYGLKRKDIIILTLEEFIEKYISIASNPHRISFYQIALIEEGEGHLWIDTNNFPYTSNSVFTATMGQIVSFEFKEKPKGYILLFSEEYINKQPGDLEWLSNLNMFNPFRYGGRTDVSHFEYIELITYLKIIEYELKIKDDYLSDSIVINLLKIFILMVERLNKPELPERPNEMRDAAYIEELKKYIEQGYAHTRSVHYYAEKLGISQKKLNELALIISGKPAKRYIEERVVLETKRLLLHTNQTIKQISISVGFNDTTNFARFFKKFVKVTPAIYRAMNKKNKIACKKDENDNYKIKSASDN